MLVGSQQGTDVIVHQTAYRSENSLFEILVAVLLKVEEGQGLFERREAPVGKTGEALPVQALQVQANIRGLTTNAFIWNAFGPHESASAVNDCFLRLRSAAGEDTSKLAVPVHILLEEIVLEDHLFHFRSTEFPGNGTEYYPGAIDFEPHNVGKERHGILPAFRTFCVRYVFVVLPGVKY